MTLVPTTRIPAVLPRAPVFRGAGLTHAGRVRERNEDSILTDPTGVLWAVADGMGGYGDGDVASDIVTECISSIADDALPEAELRLRLQEANRRILAITRERGSDGMGATAVCLMIQGSIATVAWAGDCRAYLWRRASLRMLTHDHTVVQDMVDRGLLRSEDSDNHPERHVVTRAIGIEPEIAVDTVRAPLVPGDRLLLCSDGLTACLGDQQIADQIAFAAEPDALCGTLVNLSLEAGAPDNVSVIAIFAEEG